MIERLIQFDVDLFLFLNGIHNSYLDFVFWWASQTLVWIPVFICFLYFVIRVYRWQALFVVLFVAVCILITDQVAFYGFKETFQRLRPTHNYYLHYRVYTLHGYLGGDYGFVSNHAANYFGLATFLSILLFRKIRHFTLLVFFWASVISYSRIYMGVHYPADVACGALLGIFVGLPLGYLFKTFSAKVLSPMKFFRLNSEEEMEAEDRRGEEEENHGNVEN